MSRLQPQTTIPIPVHPRRRRRPRKRPDVTTFIALLGLAGVIYLMETDIVSMQQQQLGDSANNAPPRRGDEGGSLKTKDMEEFAVWVQEAAGSIADKDEIQRQRLLAILKTKWPECIDDNLTALQCKALIDNEIQNTELFTGPVDKAIQTVILHTRTVEDDNYNYVVIRTNADSGRTTGVWQDGWVYYDFSWNSTGTEAEEEVQKEIPPWNGNPSPQGAATIDEFRGNSNIESGRRLAQIDRSKIIAGGTYTLNYTDTPAAAASLDSFLSTPKTIGNAGPRNIGPWYCKGLSGVSCCAKIKHSVRDKDVHGKAVQCWIEPYTNGLLTKKLCEEDLTKVCIYEAHDGSVWKDPILSFDRILDAAIDAGRDITKSEGEHK